MPQQPQAKNPKAMLVSENKAAELLERDRQTVKRALRGVAPDGHERGSPRFKIATVMNAMASHERMTGGGSRSAGVG
jgi:hypothetical protein